MRKHEVKTRLFWILSNSGESKQDRNGTLSWDLAMTISNEDWHSLGRGVPIDRFKHPVSARAERLRGQEDMPWCADGLLIVSERLRNLWEEMYPGNVQYFRCR